MGLTDCVSFSAGLAIVTFGGLTHFGRRSLNQRRGQVTQLRTYQSEGKENADDQKRSDHHRAAEEASTGFCPAPPGPQIILTLGSPGLETFLTVTSFNARQIGNTHTRQLTGQLVFLLV